MLVRSGCGVSPVASTETASTMSGRSQEEGVGRAVPCLEPGHHGVQVGELDSEGVVGPVVAEMRPCDDAHPLVGNPLRRQLGAGDGFQRRRDLADTVDGLRLEWRLDRLLPHHRGVRQTDAEGGEDTGHRRDQHGADAQRVGDRAGVLATGAAERRQHVVGDVVAPLHRDPLHRVGHVGHGDLQVPVGDLLRGAFVSCRAPARRRRARRTAPARPRRRAVGRRQDRTPVGSAPAGCGRASRWRR